MRRGLAFLVVLAGCGSGDAPPAGPRLPPAVLLMTWDTTRADRLGCYGDATAHTPVADALAARGLRFERAWAAAPITLPSHATILSGTWPVCHGLRVNADAAASPAARLLQEALAERGFLTGAFVGSFVLDARFGLAQGFATYHGPPVGVPGSQAEEVERPANDVVDDALAFLATAPRDRPLFLWVHFYDPHQPLRPPQRLLPGARDAYAAEIAFCDEQAGRLLAALAPRDPLVVLTADHGEALGEHGEATHGMLLHDATLRVPLLLAGPGVSHGVVAAPVGSIDIAATILQALDLPATLLPDQQGRSLLDPAGADRALLIETRMPWQTRRWHALDGIVWQGWKLVEGARAELFELAQDPGESHDVAVSHADRVEALRARRAALAADCGSAWAQARTPDADELVRLAALGYTGGAPAGTDGSLLAAAPDPRDRLGDVALADEALELLRQGRALLGLDPGSGARDEAAGRERLAAAAALLEGVLAGNPEDPTAVSMLGLVRLALGNTEEACALFE